MLKKLMLMAFSCGLTWTGTAQAGFLGNDLELQLLQDSMLHTNDVGVTSHPNNTPIGGIDVNFGDNSLDLTGVVSLPTPLNVIDINDSLAPITDAVGIGPGTASHGQNAHGHQYTFIDDLNGEFLTTSVDVSFANDNIGEHGITSLAVPSAATVPEPGAIYLVALGLTMLWTTTYLSRRANT